MSADATFVGLVFRWHKPGSYGTALQRRDRDPQTHPIGDSLTNAFRKVGSLELFSCPEASSLAAPPATNQPADLFRLYTVSSTLCLEKGRDKNRWTLLRR